MNSKPLTKYLNSDFVAAANALRPKKARHRIVAYVESYEDISFWRALFDEFEDDKIHFEVMLPARTSLSKGKKQAMMNMLGSAFGSNMIACVDSDYDYLLQGATDTSRRMIENPHILDTYAYAIENDQCYAESLHQVCVHSTLNDTKLLDIAEFMKMYSRICFPLFLWSIMLYRAHDLNTMPLLKFSEIVRLTSFNLGHPEQSLRQLNQRVKHNLSILSRRRPDLRGKLNALKTELLNLGVTEDTTYLYVQGHQLVNGVVMRILNPLCRSLRQAREEEIQRLAYHRVQYTNELSAYRNSQCDVALVLRRNTNYKDCPLYEKLRADVRRLLENIKSK
jgi:hypothetical protein